MTHFSIFDFVVALASISHATSHTSPPQGTGGRSSRLGKHVLQIQVEVFHTVAPAAEHGEDGTYNLAVLVAYKRAAKSQMGIYHRGQNRVEFVQNEK